MALVACAAHAAACQSSEPTLDLEFAGLPSEVAQIAVTLSSREMRFSGQAVHAGATTLTYIDGAIHLEIDRSRLTDRDHARFGFRLSTVTHVEGDAVAGERVAHIDQELQPGEDAILRFDFVEPDLRSVPPDDLSVADLSAPIDAALPSDLAKPVDLASPVDQARSPDLASYACSLSVAPTAAAAAQTTDAPALAYHAGSQTWGVAWAELGASIRYNAVDNAGSLKNTSADYVVVPAAANTSYGVPVLAASGAQFLLGYGQKAGANTAPTTTRLRTIDPATVAVSSDTAASAAVNDANPPEVGGLAVFDDGSTRPVLLAAHYLGFGATTADAHEFTSSPSFTRSAALSSTAFWVSAAWAGGAARFAIAALVNATAAGGMITTFDDQLAFQQSFPFTAAPDSPRVSGSGFTVDVAGAGDRFVVAWTDKQACVNCNTTSEVFLAAVYADGSGRSAAVGEQQVRPTASGMGKAKYFPRVVYDGTAVVVAWLEYANPSDSTIWMRRFDLATLAPLGPAVAMTSGYQPQFNRFGFTAGAPREYGVVALEGGDKPQFTKVTCAGP